jgi:hypothetical protein
MTYLNNLGSNGLFWLIASETSVHGSAYSIVLRPMARQKHGRSAWWRKADQFMKARKQRRGKEGAGDKNISFNVSLLLPTRPCLLKAIQPYTHQ